VHLIETFLSRGLRAALFASACFGVLCGAANAQDLPGGAQLGMTVPQLREAVPELKSVARPARLAGGVVGSWSGPAVDIAGVELTPTFFFAEAQLRRVEYLASSGADTAAFNSLLKWGRTQWGSELASWNPEGAYASWANDEADVYLQETSEPERGRLRLVIKRRLMKDGSEL